MMPFLMSRLDVLLVILAFVLYVTLWLVKRRELKKVAGVEANVIFTATRPIQKYFGVLERVMSALVLVLLATHLLVPRDFVLVGRLFGEGLVWLTVLGAVLVLGGLGLCRLAQVTIGSSWRVGIDEQARPGLVTRGIYTWIRNPTYSGLFLLCGGIFLILPTILIAQWILLFVVMMEFQVRCEEEYLETQYGAQFRDYAARTKRYIPMVY